MSYSLFRARLADPSESLFRLYMISLLYRILITTPVRLSLSPVGGFSVAQTYLFIGPAPPNH